MLIHRSRLRTILRYTGPHVDKTTFHTVDKDDSSTSFLNKSVEVSTIAKVVQPKSSNVSRPSAVHYILTLPNIYPS